VRHLLRRLRDLSLKAKVTLTLAAAFAATALVFLLVLLPLQREQGRRLLEQDKRLVSTLRDKYQRDFIYDVLSENDPSLEVDLADLARQPGIVWVRLEAGPRRVSASADPAVLRRLLGAEAPGAGDAAADAPVLLVRDGQARLVSAGGRPLLPARAVERARLPPWRSDPSRPFAEVHVEGERNGETALYALFDLKAADETYGRLHVLYSMAELRRSAALARTLFYGLIGTSFVLLLLLLNLFIARIVLAPVRRVMQAMQEASSGRLGVRLEVHSDDEIGRMAGSFNLMVEDLAASKREVEDYSRNLEAMVTERTRALRESEAALLRVKSHLATVIDNVGTGVVSLDELGRVSTFNPRAAQILGVAQEGGEGRALEEVLGAGDGPRLVAFVAPVQAGARARAEGQLTLKLPQGRRTLSVVASALTDEGGRRAGVVVVFDDLTQLLATQRLTAWKEAVEKVIHEIKNPLTPVGLAAQTLQSAHERDRARFDELFPAACELILKSVRDLKALIAEFTQFSRLPKAVPRRLDLNALVAETLALYASAPPDGVSVRLEPAAELPAVEGDPDQLRRVLLNVVNNGIESMSARGGELRVATSAEGARRVRVRVRDQGTGVEDVERIFEPYYTTKVKGTGLGLLIARQIVEDHGGCIVVESEPGAGTEVTIELPAAPQS
jgi:two-component system nitrogen regulation sensor histidine kinase NtrY